MEAMLLVNAVLSALLNVSLLGGIPFLIYFLYHKRRHKRKFGEIARRAGLQPGESRYIGYSLIFAVVSVAILVIWPPPLAPFLREGSPQRVFGGLGFGGPSILMALLYGVVKTGFSEEFLFRGLVAGSLSRRLPILWANLAQALLFLVPHLLVLRVMPEMWGIIPVVFVGALFMGWVRIKSGSIFGPWLMHASGNVAICLSVAIRTTGG
jgi:membrane protease YdiL (CAAX protease family)